MRTIPIRSTPSGSVEVNTRLAGVRVTIAARWDDRADAWYITVRSADGEDLVTGERLVPGNPLWTPGYNDRLPPGIIYALDRSGTGDAPDIEDLGTRVGLIFISTEELEEIAADAEAEANPIRIIDTSSGISSG